MKYPLIGFLTLFLVITSLHSAFAFTEKTTGMEFIGIKGGTFIMGDIYGIDNFAKPTHKVEVPDFSIGRFEVTFEQYDAFCKATQHPLPDDRGWGRGSRPVINISWQDAVDFTDWLSEKSGRNMRLPSEAEWEYAAKSGQSSNFFWGNRIGTGNANCRSCGSEWDKISTAPVGSFRPNGFGLYDMHGNVYEWVLDAWNKNYTGAPTDGSAWMDGDTSQRVSRGGSFNEIPNSLYSTARNWSPTEESRFDIGFRVVMEP